MINFIIGMILGTVLGALFGFAIAALLTAASERDRKEEK